MLVFQMAWPSAMLAIPGKGRGALSISALRYIELEAKPQYLLLKMW